MVIFPSVFFLGNIGQENVFYDILEQKNVFLNFKKKKLNKSKNWDFFKGVNPWFWSKNGHFSISFFLRQCRPGKCVLRYSRTKKRLSIKTRSLKSRKIEIFPSDTGARSDSDGVPCVEPRLSSTKVRQTLSNLTLFPHQTKTAVPNWFRRRSFAVLNSSVRFGTWVERRLNRA